MVPLMPVICELPGGVNSSAMFGARLATSRPPRNLIQSVTAQSPSSLKVLTPPGGVVARVAVARIDLERLRERLVLQDRDGELA